LTQSPQKDTDFRTLQIFQKMQPETLCDSWRRLFTFKLVSASVVMLGAVDFGYTMAFSLPAQTKMPADWGNATYWEWFTSVTSLAAILGPMVFFFLTPRFSRRGLLCWNSLFSGLVWLLFLACGRRVTWLGLLLRGLSGIAIGIFSVLVPVFLIEISPPESTGFFGSLDQLGIACGFVICYGVSTMVGWQALAGIGAGVSLLLAVLIILIPDPEDVSTRNDPPGMIPSLTSETSIRNLLVAIVIMIFQQTTGINVVLVYDVDPNDAIVSAALVQLAHVVSCLFGAFFIERIGRRMMWAVSLLLCALAQGAYALTYLTHKDLGHKLRVSFVFVFLLGYGLGGGPIPWFFVPERFPPPIRASAASIIAIVNWVFAFGVIWLRFRFQGKLDKWEGATAFAILSVIGGIFGLFFIRNPDVQARRAQVLHSEADLYEGYSST
jgi:MFS family permease